jgi:radical SAM protein with 4Fe4S-binding SPASM domain
MGVMGCIEITNICNCRCTFCPYPIMTRKKELMPLSLVKRSIDEAASLGLDVLCLHVLGEPTLHPDIEEILNYCAVRNLPLKFTSNGTTDKFATLIPLVKRGTILYSLQTPRELYPMKCSPISWEEQIRKLRQAITVFLTSGTCRNVRFEIHLLDTRPVTGVKVFDDNEKIITTCMGLTAIVEEIERELGTVPFRRPGIVLAPGAFIPLQQNLFIHLKSFSTFGGVATGEMEKGEKISCTVPEGQVVILVNGDVIQCCLNSETPMVVGNINNQSIKEIRQGAAFNELRMRCSRRLPALPNCRKCERAA